MITNLRRILFEREMTSGELAKLAKVPESSVRYFRLGRKPSIEVAMRIAKVLKINVKELL